MGHPPGDFGDVDEDVAAWLDGDAFWEVEGYAAGFAWEGLHGHCCCASC